MTPQLFHITDPAIAKAIGPHLHELGGIVIADPAYLTDKQRSDYLHTIGPLDGDELPLTIHTVDWTTPIVWDPEDPEFAAAAAYGIAAAPGDVFDGTDLSEVPRHVIEWMGLDETGADE
ncbi:hypothetical protein [Glycomyces sp. MUSA5-2]|uniref:hypothetical protein n=1 Tax=Glycomyces sp. MUSA5-2 TaxID=2053002 RepID=UPI00300B323F